ncbi:MAG: triose-phosphate isomerase [Chromatiales bacterium]
MRRPLVAGNWKMNGSLAAIAALMDRILGEAGSLEHVDVAVCPAFVHLRDVAAKLAGTPVALGAQNCSQHDAGAYTGEVAAAMLKESGCRYVIIGHSERRQYYGETDQLVAVKFAKLLQRELTPILCVGETLAERDAGETEIVVQRQIETVLEGSGASPFATAVIAYEPVWAIGTGRNATPQQAQAVHAFVRDLLARRDAAVSARARILYGGSVKAANARDLFAEPDVDGGLIGGASLNAGEFMAICRAADITAA